MAAIPGFVRSGTWTEARTPHFQIVTDAGPGPALEVGNQLERFAAALHALNPGMPAMSRLPTTVYVFRNQPELDHYRPAGSENLLAFFTQAPDRNFLVLNGSPEDVKRSEVVFHEFVHSYLTAHFPAVPIWLNEGLAEYYSTCRLSRDAAEFGKPNVLMLEWLRGQAPISIGLMFAMTPEANAYQSENELRQQFYAQSFLLTHWLQSPSRAERFDRFLAGLHRGVAPVVAFREQFPLADWEPIAAGLRGYLDRIEFEPTRRVTVPASVAGDRVTRRLNGAEALSSLGELMIWLGPKRHGEAAEHFEAALALDPGSARAHVSLGLLADMAGRSAEAEERYERALAAPSVDASIPLIAARGTLVRLDQRVKAMAPRESLTAVGALARARFARGAELDPENLEAMAGPGQVAAWLGEPGDSSVVNRLERAVAALPGRVELAAPLSYLKARQGRMAEADSLLVRHVAPVADRSKTQLMRQAVQAADLERVRDLRRQGRTSEADSLLSRVAETTLDAEVREEARRHLAASRDVRSQEDLLAVADQGVLLAKEGRLDAARARFVEVRDRATNAEMRREAEQRILRLDWMLRLQRAVDLAKQNRLREAEAALRVPDSLWADDDMRTEGASILARVRGQRQTERALELTKQGKLVEARAAFVRLLGMEGPPEMKDYARRMIKDLDAAMGKR